MLISLMYKNVSRHAGFQSYKPDTKKGLVLRASTIYCIQSDCILSESSITYGGTCKAYEGI